MQKKTILIVEDDPGIRVTLQQILELEGYEVATAEHGQAGLDLLKKGLKASIILLDLMMPVMDGLSFLKEKRKDLELSKIPVLILSAFGDHAGKIHEEGFIKKPIDLEFLLERIVALT